MAVTVDVSEVIDLVYAEAARLRTDAIVAVLESCQADCPVSQETPTNPNPGTLRDSLEIVDSVDQPPIFGASVQSDTPYSQFTDEVDTGERWIEVRSASMLRFWWEDGPRGPDIYYFKRVYHRGTKGQKWFAQKNPQRWDDALNEVSA